MVLVMLKKYQISPYFFLPSVENNTNTNQWRVIHKNTKEIYTINEAIYTFLTIFTLPTTFTDGLQQFAVLCGATEEEIAKIVDEFFGEMYEQEILIREEVYLHLQKSMQEDSSKQVSFFKKFEILKTLSEDNYSNIYLVENKVKKNKSIVKVLYLNRIFSEEQKKEQKKAFLQEIKIHQEINGHPAITGFEAFKVYKNSIFLQTTYSSGIGLYKFLSNNTLLSLQDKIQIYLNIVSAYSHLHQKDVLHGDIHANNILVDTDFSVKIIDFDMSYHHTSHENEIIVRGGIREYVAPEKLSYDAFEIVTTHSDFQSEVYQLGVIGYYIFFNKYPFIADTWKELARKIEKETPFFDNSFAKIPEMLVCFLQVALAKKPINRFISAKEMEKALSMIKKEFCVTAVY